MSAGYPGRNLAGRPTLWIGLALLLGGLPSALVAQVDEDDNSGTNPIAFTFDWRMYAETQDLDGDNSLTQFTFEQRFPLFDGALQFRHRSRFRQVTLDTPNGKVTSSGFGDMDVRLLYVPVLNQKFALATGLEGFLDTATQPELGGGHTALGPQIFFVFFGLFGPGTIFAPGYQYQFDIAGDGERSISAIDLFVLYVAPSKKWWFLADPQIIFDHDNDVQYGLLEADIGWMMFGPMSNYVRPGIGIGEDRAYDWNVEFGLKVIWR